MDRLTVMEAFVRVVDAGSFSCAAKQLRIGQPAVSKTIAQLEDRLGVRLLLRSTHGLTPTEAGRNFYDRAKRSIEEAEKAELAARGAAASLSGRLRICAGVTFARLHIMPRLAIFLEQHPTLDVDLVLQDGDIDLVEAGIDVALRMSPLRDSMLTARKIAQCQRRVVGTPGFFAANGVPQTPADLIALQAIVYEQQRLGGATWTFRQGTAETSVTMAGRVHVTAAEGVREAVFAGLGFVVASEWMFAPELKSGAVVSVLDDWSLPPVELRAVFPSGRQASAKARAFASFVEAEMSRKVPSQQDRLDINAAVREVIALTAAELQRKRVRVQTRLCDGLPFVAGDRVQLQQVMTNLIINAVEAMSGIRDGTRLLTIVSGEGDANDVFVEVQDTGPGIDPADLDRLFQSFYTTKPDGMGLGLTISRSIVEAHSGRLAAAPKQPHGAVFRFTLPVEDTSCEGAAFPAAADPSGNRVPSSALSKAA